MQMGRTGPCVGWLGVAASIGCGRMGRHLEGEMADQKVPRDGSILGTRRALLTAAAGSAAALVATAAMPLTAVAADPDDVVKGTDNATTATTSVTNSGPGSTALSGAATGSGAGYGVLGTSTGGGGVVGWSVSPPDGGFSAELTAYTGVFGSAPAYPSADAMAAGVWGDSPDIGVFGSGGSGVIGYGYVGVEGDANDGAGSVGVWAWAPTTSQLALKVTGKVQLSRSGRQSMAKGKSSYTKSLAGVTTSSKVFAVLATSESGRWVRAVVPAAGKFTIYLNTKLTSSAVVSWFVLD